MARKWLDSLQGGTLKPKTYGRRVTAVNALLPYFGALSTRNITPGHCDQWKAKRGAEVAARTYNIERETLRGIFNYAQRDGLILENPARFLPRHRQERSQLTIPTRQQFIRLVEELQKLGGYTTETVKFVQFLAYSGCRLAEAVGMTWGDIHFEAKSFVVTGGEGGTKSHEARTVPLFPSLESLLLEMRQGLGAAPKASDRLFTIQSAKTAMISACRRAELPHFLHHSLRHFFCSNAIEEGIDFKAIAGWVGHRDGGVLVARTYGHLRDEHSTAMAKRMTFRADAGGVA